MKEEKALKTIELTGSKHREKITVIVDKITFIAQASRGLSHVHFSTDSYIEVTEPYEMIKKHLETVVSCVS